MNVNDPESARRLCAATIQCAIKDAAGRKGGDRTEAITWLASKDATRYLDLLDMPQSTLLTRCGWVEWATEVIYDSSTPMTEEQMNVIGTSLDYLHDLKESQTADLTLETPHA